MKINTVVNNILDYIFPVGCACCGRKGEGIICRGCEKDLSSEERSAGKIEMKQRTGADGVFFAYKYGSKKLTQAIFALKQKNSRALAEYFAKKLFEQIKDTAQFDIVTNAPRSGANKTLYGYDHAETVARKLAALMNAEYKRCLVKKNTDADQKTLNYEERKKNSEGKYKVTAKEIPRAVLIVDDVCTSGETLKECINMLRQSGAETVFAAVIANKMQ